MYIADLHIHSRFSRATSKELDVAHLDWWARRKGIGLIGTGDFTHPAWRAELREMLVPMGDGTYTLKEDQRMPWEGAGETPRFVLTGEISSIYKKDGRTRKVHSLILLPSLEAAGEVSARLEAVGNIRSDGRPILGLDCRDLLELTLDACPDAEFIPAHIWTPHFSVFGAFSGFNSLAECFGDLTGHIHAVETGLSSDPPMNWRVSGLDGLTLVSHSDAHSPAKLGREADLLDTGKGYGDLVRAIRTGEGFLGTVEFFPEEGKYHLDGHRNCGVCLNPAETEERHGLCPVCGKKLTIGVEHRVEELADRPEGFRPQGAKPFESLVPLPEVIAASTGTSAAGKKTMELYERLLRELGPEFSILRELPIEDIQRAAGPCVAEGIRRLRAGEVDRRAGFDGQYGVISLLTPGEIQRLSGQISLFGGAAPAKKAPARKRALKRAGKAAAAEEPSAAVTLNDAQREAVTAADAAVAVVAGPGTGKTGTLVERIAYLMEERGAKAAEITAVTFTNQAAGELRARLEKRLGGKRAVAAMTIGTFHALCLDLLGEVRLLGQGEALELAAEVLRSQGSRMPPRRLIRAVSRVKNGASLENAGLEEALFAAYCRRVEDLGALDFDDILARALEVDTAGRRCFTHLLVDEFQDVNDAQYRLTLRWSEKGRSLFVIGDPDQSIYGFRGAVSSCFRRLAEDRPGVRTLRLTDNYRSSPEILRAALPVIERNPGGPRSLRPQRPGGAPVRLIHGEDAAAEADFIAQEIIRMTGGVDMLEAQRLNQERPARAFSDIAVLCRNHYQLDRVERALRRLDIPCVVSGRGELLEDGGVRGLLAFWRHLARPDDLAALETALRLLWDCPADLIAKAQNACEKLTVLDSDALRAVVRGRGPLEAWLDRAEEWLPLMAESPWKLVERWEERYGISPALDRLRNTAVFHPTAESLWNAVASDREADLRRAAGRGWESGAVRLMTLHAAKGLEFPAVFVAGLNAGILPSESQGSDREEERRLLYVGMTRAREELVLTWAGEPSPFLADLPGEVRREEVRRKERPAQQLKLF